MKLISIIFILMFSIPACSQEVAGTILDGTAYQLDNGNIMISPELFEQIKNMEKEYKQFDDEKQDLLIENSKNVSINLTLQGKLKEIEYHLRVFLKEDKKDFMSLINTIFRVLSR